MTHFQKVASALRGDRTDPAMPAGQEDEPPTRSPQTPTGLAGRDPGRRANTARIPGGGPRRRRLAGGRPGRGRGPPEEVGAVRSPDDDSHDYWDEAESARGSATRARRATSASPDSVPALGRRARLATRPDAQDPTMTQPDLYGTTAPGRLRSPPRRRASSQADIATEPRVTGPGWRGQAAQPVRPGSMPALRRRRACGRVRRPRARVISVTWPTGACSRTRRSSRRSGSRSSSGSSTTRKAR